jgi:predicted DNA binding CopG/RHH family protein
MRKKKDVFDVQLDAEEQKMLDSLERGEWKSVPKIKEMRKNVQQAAANYLRRKREERISIRVFGEDLERLKARAKDEGLPYQTLVTSILHKYTTGQFTENQSALKQQG